MAANESRLCTNSFVNDLYNLLEGCADPYASWGPNKSITIENPKKFVKEHRKTITGANVSSFCQKMEEWGFTMLAQFEDKLVFYNESFANGRLNDITQGMPKSKVPPALARLIVHDSASKIKEDIAQFRKELDEVEDSALNNWGRT